MLFSKKIDKSVLSKKKSYLAKNWGTGGNGSAWNDVLKGTRAEKKSIGQLWKEYTKSDFSMLSSVLVYKNGLSVSVEPVEHTKLIKKHDVRNEIKNR